MVKGCGVDPTSQSTKLQIRRFPLLVAAPHPGYKVGEHARSEQVLEMAANTIKCFSDLHVRQGLQLAPVQPELEQCPVVCDFFSYSLFTINYLLRYLRYSYCCNKSQVGAETCSSNEQRAPYMAGPTNACLSLMENCSNLMSDVAGG